MKISILIPCHNEEKSIKKCIESTLNQTRKFDEIIVIDDGSTDNSRAILSKFQDKIKIVKIEKATGNKSYAQEYGLKFVTGEVFVTSDGDTIIDSRFAEEIEK